MSSIRYGGRAMYSNHRAQGVAWTVSPARMLAVLVGLLAVSWGPPALGQTVTYDLPSGSFGGWVNDICVVTDRGSNVAGQVDTGTYTDALPAGSTVTNVQITMVRIRQVGASAGARVNGTLIGTLTGTGAVDCVVDGQTAVNSAPGAYNLGVPNTVTLTATNATDQRWDRDDPTIGYMRIVLTYTLPPNVAIWEGDTNTNWTDPLNWAGGVMPDANTDAIIPWILPTGTNRAIFGGAVNNNPTLNASSTCRSITIATGRTLSLGAGTTLTVMGNFTSQGTLTGGSGTISFQGTAAATITQTGGSFNAWDVDISKTGVSVTTSSALTVNRNFTLQATGTFTASTPGTVTFAGATGATIANSSAALPPQLTFFNLTSTKTTTLTSNDNFSVAGTYTNTTGVTTLNGTVTYIGGTSTNHTVTAGTVTYNNFTVSKDPGFTLTHGSATGFTINVDYNCTSGSFSATAGAVVFAGSGVSNINHAGAGATNFFSLTVNKSLAGLDVLSSNNWGFRGVLTTTTGDLVNTGNTVSFTSTAAAGTISVAAGTLLQFQNFTLSPTVNVAVNHSTGSFNVFGNLSSTAAFGSFTSTVGSGATVNMTDTGAATISGSRAWTFQNLIMNKTAAVQIQSTNTSTITVQVNFTVTGSTQFLQSAGTFSFTGASGSIIDNTSTGAAPQITFNNLTTNKNATIAVTTDDSYQVNGIYTNTTGNFTASFPSTITFGGSGAGSVNHTVNSGTVRYNNFVVNKTGAGGTLTNNLGATWFVDGNYSCTAGTFTMSLGTIQFATAAAPTITNTATTTFYHLTINNTGGLLTTSSNFNVAGNMTVQGTATFQALAGTVTFLTSGTAVNGNIVNSSTAAAPQLTFSGLTINKTGGATTVSSTSSWTVTGNYTNTAGTFSCTAGTVTFAGSADQTSTITAGAVTFANLTIAITGGFQLTHNGNFTLLSNYTCTSGSFRADSGTIVSDVISSPGATATISHSGAGTTRFFNLENSRYDATLLVHHNLDCISNIQIAGNYVNTQGNLNFLGGTVTFVGAGPTDIQITSGGGTYQFFAVTVAKDAGQLHEHTIGSFNILSDYTCTGGSFTSSSVGAITLSSASVCTIAHSGGGTTTFGNLTVNKAGSGVQGTSNWSVSGVFTHTAGAFALTGGTVTHTGSSASHIVNGGTVQYNNFTVAKSAGQTLTHTTALGFTVLANFSCTGGAFVASAGTITLAGAGPGPSVILNSGAGLTFFGLNINRAAPGLQVTSTTDWTVNSDFTNTQGDLICSGGTVTMGGTVGSFLSVDGGSVQFNSLAIAMTAVTRTHDTGSFNLIGNYSCTAGTFSSTSTGTITMNGGVDASISHTTGVTTTFNNLTIAKTNATVSTSSNITVTGALAVTTTARLLCVAGTVTLSGGTATIIDNTSTGTAPQLTFFNLTNTRTAATTCDDNVTITGNYTNTTGNVTFSAGTVTFAGLATRTMTATAGTLQFNNVVVNMAGGTNLNEAGAAGFSVGGNFTVTGGTFSSTAGTATFNGTTQTINSTAGTNPVFFGLTAASGSILTLASDVNVSSLLTVTGELRMTGNQTLRIGTAAASGTVTVNGTLTCSGATPTITAVSATWRMAFTVNGTINVTALNFSLGNGSGMNLASAATVTALNNVAFTSALSGAGNQHLTIACVANMTFLGCSFDASFGAGNNVEMNNAASNVVMGNWSGAGGGAAFHQVVAGILTWWASSAPNAPTGLTVNQVTNPNRPRFAATFTDPDAPDTANAFGIQVSTDSTFTAVTHWDSGFVTLSPNVANGAAMPEQMYGGTFLDWGVQFFWRIRFRDNNNTTGTWSATANFTMATPSTTFPVNGWNMFGIPSQSSQTVASVLGDDLPGPVVYEWNEVSRTYTTTTNLQVGRGYFVFGPPNFVDLDTGAARYGDLNLGTLSFTAGSGTPGWHVISHPFAYNVNWSTIVAASTNLDTIYWWWNGSSYIGYNTLTTETTPPGNAVPSWRAIWVRVTNATNTVIIPNPKNPPEPPPLSFDANFWGMHLQVDSAGAQDTSNVAGVHPNAVDTRDSYDAMDPGTLASPYVIAYFDMPADFGEAGRYAHLFSQTPFASGAQKRYPLTIEQTTGADVTLSFPNFANLPTTDWAYQLQDMDTLQVWNIVSGFTRTYTPAGATKRYDVIATRLNDFTSRLDCSLGPQNPAAGPVGSTQSVVVMMQLRLAAVNEAITVEQLRVRAAGTGNDATMLSAARLYHDVNRDGAVDAGDTLIEGPDTFVGNDGNILWWNLDWGIPMGGNEDWLVVYDFNAANTNGGTFQSWFGPSGDVVARGQSSQMLIVGTGSNVTGNFKTAPDTLAPVAPVLVAPANSTWTSINPPTFDWNDVEVGATYRVQADNDADLLSPFFDQTGIGSSQLTPGTAFPNTTIYWRVSATDAAGNFGPWSTVGFFYLDASPPIPGAVNDGLGADQAFQSSTTTLSANWTGFFDPDSVVVSYDWGIGTTPGATDVRAFTPMGLATSGGVSSLSLSGGTLYYSTVRAWNPSGLSTTSTSDGVMVDTTPPVAGYVNDGTGTDLGYQASTTSLSANWDSFVDPESGIVDYEWAIGTTPGAQDVQAFLSMGIVTTGTNGSLTLTPGATYYSTIRATNGVGQTAIATSDGVGIDTTPPTADSGFVNDGDAADLDLQISPTSLSANWGGFEDPESAIGGYSWAVGTTPGGTDVRGFVDVGGATTATDPALVLSFGTTYYVTVRGANRAGLEVSLTSDGVTPIPSRCEVSVGLGPRGNGYVAEFEDGTAGSPFRSWSRAPWELYDQRNGETHVAQGDLDGDGLAEQVVGFGSTGLGWMAVRGSLDGGRAIVRWLQVPWQDYNTYSGITWPACGNVDDDPRSEIVVGLGEYRANGGWMCVFDDGAAGNALLGWRRMNWPVYNSADGQLRPAIGDVDGDGRGEVVLGMGPAGNGWLVVMEDWIGGMGRRTSIRVPWSAYNAANGETWAASGDLDGDGRAEIAAGLGRGGAGQVCLFDDAAAGHAMTGWVTVPWSLYNASYGDTRPAIGNMDTDTTSDLVVGLGPGGGGYWLMFGNATDNFALRGWRRVPWPAYNDTSVNGETRPSIGNGSND